MLFKAADLIEARSDEIIKLQSLEMGGPIGPAHPGPHPMIERSAWNFRFFAEEQELAGNESFNRDDSLLTYTMRDPAGVFGLITPWNGPFMLSTWKMAPCLAYGNSAVHKPSELSPLSMRVLCEIFQGSRHADGRLQHGARLRRRSGRAARRAQGRRRRVVHRFGADRARHRGARREALKRTSFELGGKSANIIFADANLAARGAGRGDVDLHERGAGVRRRLAHPRAAADLRGSFSMRSRRRRRCGRAGDPFDRTTRLGPLVHKRQYDRVTGYLEIARKEGRILFGGGRPAGLDKGYYVAPTAIVDVDNSARVCQEEIFGPVAVIMPFDDADDALRIANDSTYGLAGYIWTESQTTAHYVSHRLQTGDDLDQRGLRARSAPAVRRRQEQRHRTRRRRPQPRVLHRDAFCVVPADTALDANDEDIWRTKPPATC